MQRGHLSLNYKTVPHGPAMAHTCGPGTRESWQPLPGHTQEGHWVLPHPRVPVGCPTCTPSPRPCLGLLASPAVVKVVSHPFSVKVPQGPHLRVALLVCESSACLPGLA